MNCHTPWLVQALVGLGTSLLLVGLGYYLGRLSKVERAMDRLQRKELDRPRLNDQAASDKDEAQGGAP